MNFFFGTNDKSSPTLPFTTATSSHPHTHSQPFGRGPQPSSVCAAEVANSATPTASASSSSSSQDIELIIEIESSFHGVLLGMPEESAGAVLNATAILHVRKKAIRATRLMATFDGRIKVQCSDGATFGPEQYRERVLAHKDWVLWEAGSSNTHVSSTGAGAGSRNHIPVGTHYYPLSIQLDGALPPTFSGRHGSIRYILSSTLMRPLFHSDINTVQEIEIRRCLVGEATPPAIGVHLPQPDLGSLLLDQLSRTGIARPIVDPSMPGLPGLDASPQPFMGPTTITHHNTHKELLRYTSSSPPIAYLEGGNVQIDLSLEPLPPGSYIYSVVYGLKEMIYYRSSATGNLTDNKSEIIYPIGQQTVIVPRDQERERSMASAGAGASTRQLLDLLPCPLLMNVDTSTPLIEIQHRITCNVAIVLPENSVRRRNTTTGGRSLHGFGARGADSNNEQSGSFSGGGILKRLNLTPQSHTPSLNLIDSTGTEATNNAILLGEPTHSIIEPALTSPSVELNDAPPPPSDAKIESTLLEFPIILTSRYPITPRDNAPRNMTQPELPEPGVTDSSAEGSYAYQPLGSHSYSSAALATSLHSRVPAALITEDAPQQFVHNQEIAPSIIPTTGTSIVPEVPTDPSTDSLSSSPSSTSSPNRSSQDESLSSVSPPPETSSCTDMLATSVPASLDRCSMPPLLPLDSEGAMVNTPRTGPPRSGISAGLAAVAAASVSRATEPSIAAVVTDDSPPTDELPKYEDVIETTNGSEIVSGAILPHGIPLSMPMSVPMQVPNRRGPSYVSPAAFSFGASQSPVNYQINSLPRNRSFASPSSSSPISPFMAPSPNNSRDGSRFSPPVFRNSESSEASRPIATMSSASPQQPQQTTFSGSIHNRPTVAAVQAASRHQRQRSVGTATIIGSLGCYGGYLSQQPAPPAMPDFVPSSSPLHLTSLVSPPAYVE
ncbi:hypothetical protein BGW38_002562 [Lunasporangiospora selenospora]|uniref:Arrestin-like N-terminal domain-containing protein n=1 Tax=Lunasporangiospora selenospora TaxID=979761 RepID=A0A9P6KDG4_9FUNG|nr:hypothetical protein BGW38_002562 [Lunasporangiospora selenospora]